VTASPTTRHLHHLARGGAVGLAGAAVSAVAGFALVVVVTRGFSPDRAGAFFAANAVFLILVALATLGTETGLGRFLLRHHRAGRPQDVRRTVRTALLPALGTAVVTGAALVLAAEPLARALGLGPDGTDLLTVLALVLPCAVLAEVCLATTRAMGTMRTTALVDRVGRAGLQLALTVVVVASGGGLLALGAGWAAAYVVSAVIAVLAVRRFLRRRLGPALGPPRPVAHEFWSFTWPRGVTRLAQIMIQKVDIVLVAALTSPGHAAVYTAATRFVALGQFATQALQQAVQPRFTVLLLQGDRQALREVYRVATAWNIAVTWPLYLVIGCAPAAYLSLFGDAYVTRDAGLVVVVMLVAMLLAVASGPVDTLLLMAGRSRTSLGNALVALAIDVTLCLVLIPVLGILGAALAWAAAVTARCGLAFHQVRRQLAVTPAGREVAGAAVAALVVVGGPVAAYSAAGGHRLTGLLAVAGLAATGYAITLWALRRLLRLDLLVGALLGRARPSLKENTMSVRRLMGRTRDALPPRVVRAVRSVALGWGMATADLRMNPSFVVVGAQRGGTTTLFRLLEQHPDLVRPTLSKGTGYFDDDHHRGFRWYHAHFPLRLTGLLRTRRLGRARTFECSGYYMFHPLAAARIAAELPGVRLVAMVRDPVERAHSAHRHELMRGFEELDFDQALALEQVRTAGEAGRLVEEPAYRSFAHRHHAYLGRSEYADQVARLVEAVGVDHVFVLDADQFFADPVPEFHRLQDWLGLSRWTPEEVPRWNARPRDPLDPAERLALLRHFEPHDARLAGFLGHVPSWRRSRVSS
jgi:O-antigen/teichoic acid export membrane protein